MARSTPSQPRRAGEASGRIVWKNGVPVYTGDLPDEMKRATPEQIRDAAYAPPFPRPEATDEVPVSALHTSPSDVSPSSSEKDRPIRRARLVRRRTSSAPGTPEAEERLARFFTSATWEDEAAADRAYEIMRSALSGAPASPTAGPRPDSLPDDATTADELLGMSLDELVSRAEADLRHGRYVKGAWGDEELSAAEASTASSDAPPMESGTRSPLRRTVPGTVGRMDLGDFDRVMDDIARIPHVDGEREEILQEIDGARRRHGQAGATDTRRLARLGVASRRVLRLWMRLSLTQRRAVVDTMSAQLAEQRASHGAHRPRRREPNDESLRAIAESAEPDRLPSFPTADAMFRAIEDASPPLGPDLKRVGSFLIYTGDIPDEAKDGEALDAYMRRTQG